MGITRRDFMQGTIVFSAGAAVGVPADKGRKEHGPVDLRLYVFSTEPYVVKVGLSSDEAKDLYRIRVLPIDIDDKPGEARLSLSKVRQIVDCGSPAEVIEMECVSQDGETGVRKILLSVHLGDVVLEESGAEGNLPFRMDIQDVRRVL